MDTQDKKQIASQAYALKYFKGMRDLTIAKEAWLDGYTTATQWIRVDEITPEYNKPVLLKYLKGKKKVITQGYFQDEAFEIAKRQLRVSEEKGVSSVNGIETVEFWERNGRGETYFDYADRQIQYLGAKTSKNKVIAWRNLD